MSKCHYGQFESLLFDRDRMKKVLKWVGIVILTPILLFILLTILLYIPPIQNWAAKKVAAYASEQTGMEITVGRVSLKFPLDLAIEDFKMIKKEGGETANENVAQNPGNPSLDAPSSKPDTIADVGRLVVDVRLLPLFKNQVEIDALEFNRLKLNTNGFIHEARVKGTVGRLYVESHNIDLNAERLRVNTALLSDARVSVELSDTVPPDSTESANFWKIHVDSLNITNTDVTVHMPGDTMQVRALLGRTTAHGGYFDLYKGEYKVQGLDWNEGALNLDYNFEPCTNGLDFNHIALTDVSIGLDSLYYCGAMEKPEGLSFFEKVIQRLNFLPSGLYAPRSTDLRFVLRRCSFKEQCGIEVNELTGQVMLDDTKISLPAFSLRTPDSYLSADFVMDLNTFDDRNPGRFYAQVNGSFGKQDIMRFMGDMPQDFIRRWPNQPLTVNGLVRGNMQRISFEGLNVNLPSAFNAKATGYVANFTDTDHLRADMRLKAKTYDLGFVTALIDRETAAMVRIPKGIDIDGQFLVDGNAYDADFTAAEGGGSVKAKIHLDAGKMNYTAQMNAVNLQLQHFLPSMGVSPFTGYVTAKGSGTDFMSPKTRLEAHAEISKFSFGGYNLDGVKGTARIQNGRINADIDSHNPLLNGKISFSALTHTKRLQGTFVADLDKADLYNLHLVEEPLITSVCAHVDVETDMKEFYKVQGTLSDLVLTTREGVYRPQDIVLDVLASRDTTHAVVDCGDFHLDMDGNGSYKQLLSEVEHFTGELQQQFKNRHLDQATLRHKLPDVRVYLTTGNDNIFSRMMQNRGYRFKNAIVDFSSSHIDGLDGRLSIDSLVMDSIQLDTIRLTLISDSTTFKYSGQIRNNKKNPQYVFNALFDGSLSETGTGLHARVYDANDKLGVDIGLDAAMEANGMRVRLTDPEAVLGYKTFTANADNYVFLGDNKRMSAKLQLKADDGTGVQILSNDDNTDALQDVTLTLNHFELEEITSLLPYLPRVTGELDGDYHIIQTADELSVSAAMSISKMTYEHYPMGDIGTEFVYMPKSDGSHYIDGVLSKDGREVGTIVGTYQSAGSGNIDAEINLEKIPLELINGFVPDQIVGLKGYGDGTLVMKGSLSRPHIDGELNMDSAYLVSVPYGVDLRFGKEPVRIVDSHLLFEDFQLYAHNESPLTINGSLDFSNMDRMMLEVRMRARNFQLIDAKENFRSEAYGKAFIDFFGTMRGPLDNLRMRGRIGVLGSTDMTYVLRDSPLTTDNRLEELVTFIDFKDSTQLQVSRPPLSGLDMDLSINIDEGAHIKCDLNSDKTNYIDLIGGGDLRLQSNSIEDLRLTGRYTLANGEMKYSLPIIPLKTFTIQDGSYIEFTGDATNPKLNITATERTKASVSESGSASRSVEFECGVVITKTLGDMGLEFIIDAPEDMTVSNELNTMSKEERGKLAVTMLTTGMYLADGNTSGFSMNSALSSFLQSEINNITGAALRTLDLSFGVDNTTDASGTMHTDYSFKFAKRFWNNRLRIVVGGRVSTGSDAYSQNESFFDNVTFEYRMSQTSNKYLKLFYDRSGYDWIEGNVGRYGAGFIWKRKLRHFKDIFRFKNEEQPAMPQRTDTLRRDSVRRRVSDGQVNNE